MVRTVATVSMQGGKPEITVQWQGLKFPEAMGRALHITKGIQANAPAGWLLVAKPTAMRPLEGSLTGRFLFGFTAQLDCPLADAQSARSLLEHAARHA